MYHAFTPFLRRRLHVPAPVVLVLILVCTALAQGSALAQTSPDIVGLRFGMDDAQATAALKAHVPTATLTRTSGIYRYRDGVNQHETPPYPKAISARVQDPSEDIVVLFSSAPGPQRVIGVMRTVSLKNPPTHAQLLQQLTQKYGTPTVQNRGPGAGAALQTRLAWGEPGKPTCWRTLPNATAFPTASANAGNELVGALRHAQKKGVAPADITQCGYVVGATVIGDPAHRLQIEMSDLGAWAASDLQAQQWVGDLQKKAEQARLAKGSGPRL